tara:strand:+ start:124 stop:567 length:444 start_codon:yes stop_codon:yes gene_type:complete
MNIKNKFIAFSIFITILTLSIFNIKNPEKTKFYLFTTITEEISLGNLISITFIFGFTFSSLLTVISKSDLQESTRDNFYNDEENRKYDEIDFGQEFKPSRPPERDVRESQPTISVNYRFVDQENDLKTSKNNFNKEEDDWLNNDNEW